MAKRLQHRGGTTAQHSTFTGAVREVTVDTDKNTLVVHDGATAGGHPLATATNFTSTGIDDNATSTAITINSSQNVGIGATPSSGAKLDIYNGGINVDTTGGTLTTTRYNSGSGASLILLQKSQSATIGTHTALSNGYGIGAIITKGSDGTSFIPGTLITSEVDGSVSLNSLPTRITFSTNSGSNFYSERMRIDKSGNVGIGTTSPQQLINIQSTSNAKIRYAYSSTVYGEFGRKSNGVHEWSSYENGGDLSFGTTQVTGSTTERMRIEANGNVGIGTSSPSDTANRVTLELNDTWGGRIRNSIGGTANSEWSISTSNMALFGTIVSQPLAFTTNNLERMRIGSDGKTLVNTTSNGTASSLNVQGQFGLSTARGFIFETQEGRNGSGFTSITLQFTTGANGRTCFIESMVGSSGYYLHHIAHRYRGQTVHVLTNDGNGPTVSWSVTNDGSNTGSVYTYVVNFPSSTSHPYARFKVSLGGYITTPITSPSITFTQ